MSHGWFAAHRSSISCCRSCPIGRQPGPQDVCVWLRGFLPRSVTYQRPLRLYRCVADAGGGRIWALSSLPRLSLFPFLPVGWAGGHAGMSARAFWLPLRNFSATDSSVFFFSLCETDICGLLLGGECRGHTAFIWPLTDPPRGLHLRVRVQGGSCGGGLHSGGSCSGGFVPLTPSGFWGVPDGACSVYGSGAGWWWGGGGGWRSAGLLGDKRKVN